MTYRTALSLEGHLTAFEVHAALTRGERIWFWIAFVNFLGFVFLWFLIGGNALNGGMENGSYFVASGRSRSEVSAFVFGYSLAHTLSLFVTQPIGVILGLRGRGRVLKSRKQP